MIVFSKFPLACALAVASLSASGQAAIIVAAPAPSVVADSYLGTGDGTGFQSATTILNPDSGISSITFNSSSPGQPATGVYSGTVYTSASPYGGGNANYLAIQPGGSVIIALSAPSLTFSFLWGTVDTYNIVNDAAGSITGAAVAAADPSVVYGVTNELVTLTFDQAVSTVTFSDTSTSAFEFDTASASNVPEPASLALLGGAVVGLGVARRNKRAA